MPFVVTFLARGTLVCKHNILQNATRCLLLPAQTLTILGNNNNNNSNNIVVLLKLKFNH